METVQLRVFVKEEGLPTKVCTPSVHLRFGLRVYDVGWVTVKVIVQVCSIKVPRGYAFQDLFQLISGQVLGEACLCPVRRSTPPHSGGGTTEASIRRAQGQIAPLHHTSPPPGVHVGTSTTLHSAPRGTSPPSSHRHILILWTACTHSADTSFCLGQAHPAALHSLHAGLVHYGPAA